MSLLSGYSLNVVAYIVRMYIMGVCNLLTVCIHLRSSVNVHPCQELIIYLKCFMLLYLQYLEASSLSKEFI